MRFAGSPFVGAWGCAGQVFQRGSAGCRGPYRGRLDLPGGTPEFGETPPEVLKREFREETGLEVEPVRLLEVVTHQTEYLNADGEFEAFYHIAIAYEVRALSDRPPKPEPDGEDSLGSCWVAVDRLGDVQLSPIAAAVLRRER